MSAHGDEDGGDGHGGHGGFDFAKWMDDHLSGIIMPFGRKMEVLFEHTLVLSVNGFFLRAARLCLYVMTPVILLEFVMRSVGA